ncbi:MAG: helix-turn-helix transcriptional regulator [Pigmentiphaga sp.]|uniref:helix-turn-helix transcriptional regulator n=1 Tax=Pigmentiphaga sp. TaxID=1977564 RepID=UPI0029AA04BD|nr:helix-turn-helix transcriptional regulator [Pigmentiphaga sp.]MDX3907771.1 helix-turn-helix transcriptional regulator [Pigmentiphaga sp.]
MPPHRPNSQALMRLQLMAGLDVGGPQLIQPLLQTLHRVIGFDSGGYFYVGDDGGLEAHMEDPGVGAAVPEHFDPRILRSESEVFHNTLRQPSDISRHGQGARTLGQMLKTRHAELLRSDYYNVVMRPARVADWLCLPLSTPRHPGIGILFLFRPPGARPFGPEEVATLTRLEAHLACALQPGDRYADDGEVHSQGLLVATPQGRPLWISPEAEALMPQAFGWRWRRSADLPPVLQSLLQRLAPKKETPLAPPQLELRNAQGWFSLRAMRLAAAAGQDNAVGITITRRMARGIRLLSTLHELDLPRRQYELAYWLARGLSESQIAQRMGISSNTVVYHRRQLYNRLGAGNRTDLLAQLGARFSDALSSRPRPYGPRHGRSCRS